MKLINWSLMDIVLGLFFILFFSAAIFIYRFKWKIEKFKPYPRSLHKIIWNDFLSIITNVRWFGFLLFLLSISFGVTGYLSQHKSFSMSSLWGDFYANISTELVSIAITVLFVDFLYSRKSKEELKKQLIREMGNANNVIALRAVNELRAHGWLRDGTLKNERFYNSDLTNADLKDANLSGVSFTDVIFRKANLANAKLNKASIIGCDLSGANFARADLEDLNSNFKHDTNVWQHLLDTQFKSAFRLIKAKMPEGNKYDGRYNLKGDLDMINGWNFKEVDLNTPDGMAKSYGVTLEEYLAGQRWFEENSSSDKSPDVPEKKENLKTLFFAGSIAIISLISYIKGRHDAK